MFWIGNSTDREYNSSGVTLGIFLNTRTKDRREIIKSNGGGEGVKECPLGIYIKAKQAQTTGQKTARLVYGSRNSLR